MDKITEQIQRRRMHGLYLSRQCDSITPLSRELLGLHCWFHRNVAFSALIRGASLFGWQTALTKTWLYRGTLHGVAAEDLPLLLALHPDASNGWLQHHFSEETLSDIAEKVVRLIEDGVYSRAEMRQIFADEISADDIDMVFSSWGGIFVKLARQGRVAFRDMTSRDFDLISAEPTLARDEALPQVLRRFFKAYGPATIEDATWFFGFQKEKKLISDLDLSELDRLEVGKKTYYYLDDGADMGDIPGLTLLSGFDPLIVSYIDRSAVLNAEYKKRVVMSSGICLPTIAIHGKVEGIWNIKKNTPVVEFFSPQQKRITDITYELVDSIRRQTMGLI